MVVSKDISAEEGNRHGVLPVETPPAWTKEQKGNETKENCQNRKDRKTELSGCEHTLS